MDTLKSTNIIARLVMFTQGTEPASSGFVSPAFPVPWCSSLVVELDRDLEAVAVSYDPDHTCILIRPNSSVSRLRLQHCANSVCSVTDILPLGLMF